MGYQIGCPPPAELLLGCGARLGRVGPQGHPCVRGDVVHGQHWDRHGPRRPHSVTGAHSCIGADRQRRS